MQWPSVSAAVKPWSAAAAACLCAIAVAAPAEAPVLDRSQVGRLQIAFGLRTGRVGAESGAPAAADGLLFVLTPFPHVLHAIDPATRRVRWRRELAADRRADGLACCDRSDHGPVVADGRVIVTTADGHVVAFDAATGAPRYDVVVADLAAGEALAGPPAVGGGRVYVGSSGGDNGARGFVLALDAADGRTLWKRFNTGPDADVGIGPQFAPADAALRGADLGTATWPAGAWQHGGGGVAGTIVFDAGVVIHGSGHPAPWNAEPRPGVNRWTGGLFARDAATGSARWFAPLRDGDPYGYHEVGADLLLQADVAGEQRPVLVHPDPNGMLYLLDRGNGALLAADRIDGNVVDAVDVRSGRTTFAPARRPQTNRQTRDICPAWTGAFGAGAGSTQLDGRTLVVLPLSRLCMDLEPRSASYIRATPYIGANVRLKPNPVAGGAVVGWDLAGRRAAWRVDEPLPVLGGVLVQDGVVFYGTLDGRIKALDVQSGRTLWRYDAPAAVIARPTVMRGSDGKPYLAVVVGSGRLFGSSRVESLDPRDRTSGLGVAALVPRLPRESGADAGGSLLVFTLP